MYFRNTEILLNFYFGRDDTSEEPKLYIKDTKLDYTFGSSELRLNVLDGILDKRIKDMIIGVSYKYR